MPSILSMPALLLIALLLALPAHSAPPDERGRGPERKYERSHDLNPGGAAMAPRGYAPAADAGAGRISARDAASAASRQYGGRVLRVNADGNGYRVKLLQPSGRVIQVHIDERGGR
jgi:hypothetical protein